MPKTQRPEDVGSVITGILGRLHRLEWSRSSAGGGLTPTDNDGTHLIQSDTSPVPLDGSFHYVTWTTYSGVPSWATVPSAGSLNFSITEPGLYVGFLRYDVTTDPTTPDQPILVDGPFFLSLHENVSELSRAQAVSGGNFPTSNMETAQLSAADVPWTTSWRVKTPTDDTGELHVTATVAQIAHL